ncbi:MAG: HEAT repeat domain-containing protein [Verrucomicrobiia bacterium]
MNRSTPLSLRKLCRSVSQPLACLSTLVLALVLAPFAQAAPPVEAISKLRTFQYGGDASSLAEIEKAVAAATAEAPSSEGRASLAGALAAILESSASVEAKQFVCRQLAIIGTVEQVPVLEKLLTDDALSDMARYALAPVPDPSAGRALRNALTRCSGKARIGIINSLAHRQDPEAVPLLAPLLKAEDTESARTAAAALGKIGGPDAARLLTDALKQASPQMRSDIADACLACAERLRAMGEPAAAAAIYHQLYAAQEPSWIRSAALRGLVATGSEGVQLATAALRDSDPVIVRAAIGCIQSIPGSDATRQFAAELPKLPAAAQAVLINALSERADAAAYPAVEKAAASTDPAVRMAAIRALGILGDRSTVALLVRIANATVPERAAALESLRALRADGVDTALTAQLESASSEARVRLISVLADRQADSAVQTLVRFLESSDQATAIAAAKALGQIAGPSALPSLLRTLTATDSEALREASEAAAIAVARRITPPAEPSGPVLEALRTRPSPAAQGSLLRVLAGVGAPEGLTAVLDALKDQDETVRDSAVRALADWPTSAALQPLRGVFEKAESQAHRALALRGVVRLADPAVSQEAQAQALSIYEQIMPRLKGAEEVQLALSGLAGINDRRALGLIAPHLDSPGTKEEAAAATAKVAALIAGSDPEAARQASERVLAVSTLPAIRKQASDVLQELQKSEDFILHWQLAGPFTQQGKSGMDLFDVAFPPEQSAASVEWRRIKAPAAGSQPAIVDLMGLLGGSQRVAYLRTQIHSAQRQPARLELGSDDGIKAWLNGAVVHANRVDRGLAPGQDTAPVTLNEGWNVLLLKITQGDGGWAACARLRKPDGSRLSGVRFEGSPSAR